VTERFEFLFEPKVAVAAAAFGVTRRTARVEVDDLHLTVRFGPWRLLTALTNIESAEITGPYAWWKVAGPPHLSFADRGVTFATTTERGLCLGFRRPVPALLPFGALRHPGATLTVAEPERLLAALPRQSLSSTMTSR
jgi:hypothetical protein